MRIGTSYKQHGITGDYDAVVIGSGIGGLGAAALLAIHGGKRVLVLERHYTAGGFTHTFTRKGYEWDVGVHYVGQTQPNTLLRKVFDEVTGGELDWADMGEVYDKIIIGGDVYEMVKGRRNFRERMCEYFPGESAAIDAYMDLVREAVMSTRRFFAEKAVPRPVAAVLGPLMRRPALKLARKTTAEVLEGLTDNRRLIGVLTGQYGDYGLPPAQSSFVMHALVVNHYWGGGAYPVGGSSRIAATMLPVIEARGGAVITNAEVDEIVVSGGRAVGVRLVDGNEIRAPMVISDAGVHTTFERLVSDEVARAAGFDRKARALDASVAHACLYLGLRGSAADLGLEKANLWIYPSDDHDGNVARFVADQSAPLPVAYCSFPAAKDPDFERRFPGRSTVEVITLAPYECFAPWADRPWMKRGDDYQALKDQFSDRLMSALLEQCPQLEGAVEHAELSTPLSTRHFTGFARGEIYGLSHGVDRFEQKWLRPRTPVKNLYLTGADVCSAGVGGALFGGVVSASAILGRNLIGAIVASAGSRRAA